MITLRAFAVLALVPGLAGCALFPRAAAWVDFKAVQTSEVQRFSRQDGYYNSAAAAIERRDYATALDLLQGARAAKPDDVRVLNAFAVVYDKLGRFDLSARYYGQAERLDPGSPVLARNIAYSANLQARLAAPPSYALARAEPAPSPVARIEPSLAQRPAVVRLAMVAPAPVALLAPGQTGRPLELADASGRAGGAASARAALRRLGWSVDEIAAGGGQQANTTITYGDRNALVAQALQRTLPGPASLVRCRDNCPGIRLAIGADAAKWTWPARGDQALKGD
ncbi:LytR C-terminal domain-containing protein [Phenylobacterium sp.]|uniref:LytR C-terminal domain-containing protein n=1 Tax=Phenylobacterium sp. TaxID=1871053 RepID=UPI0025E16B29|nr:LytR C-terminal domain-containing protein [Phenylobacterium sp.]